MPEAGAHWFNTYHNHHIKNLGMRTSTYDLCLLYSDTERFGVIGLQTNDSLIVENEAFVDAEDKRLKEEKLLAKDRQKFIIEQPIKFNGGSIKKDSDGNIYLNQKNQCKNFRLVNLKKSADVIGIRGKVRKAITSKDQYVAQRARGAYIATVSQPEAVFDLSFAA